MIMPEVFHMKIRKGLLALCIGIPLAVGGLSALLTGNSMQSFSALKQPPLSPPGWLFPVAWTLLYILMGIACYLVVTSAAPEAARKAALRTYAAQLFFNGLWTLLFFRLEWRLFALAWLIVLWLLILVCAMQFGRIRKAAGWLLAPYLAWTTFAAYLNLGVWLLNR
jgi:tryptophan-rich sensory protein